MNTNFPTTPKTLSEMEKALEALATVKNNLDDSTKKLSARLDPLLTTCPSSSSDLEKDANPNKDPDHSMVVKEILTQVRQLQKTNMDLIYLIDRLEV